MATEIFRKKLTNADIERKLYLPNDAITEALPPVQGGRAIVFPVMFEQAGREVEVHCSGGSGRLGFATGWIETARDLRLNPGDVVTLHKEDQGTVQYKLTVRRAT